MEDVKKRNLKLVIAYNGSAYRGWQRQARGIDTVQLHVEAVAKKVLRHPLHVHGCSRTDSGVHAEGQVANIRTPNMTIPTHGLRMAMNSRLPRDIAIRSVTEMPADFNSSLSSTGKTYRYRIHLSPVRPVQLAGMVWHYWRPLDVGFMQEAAARLVGEHDFRGFAGSADRRLSSVRNIYRCDVTEDPATSEIHVTVQGDGFLYNMVRNIVGTLVEVGREHCQPDIISHIFESLDRADAGPTAPPDGLTLMCVHYDPLHTKPSTKTGSSE